MWGWPLINITGQFVFRPAIRLDPKVVLVSYHFAPEVFWNTEMPRFQSLSCFPSTFKEGTVATESFFFLNGGNLVISELFRGKLMNPSRSKTLCTDAQFGQERLKEVSMDMQNLLSRCASLLYRTGSVTSAFGIGSKLSLNLGHCLTLQTEQF